MPVALSASPTQGGVMTQLQAQGRLERVVSSTEADERCVQLQLSLLDFLTFAVIAASAAARNIRTSARNAMRVHQLTGLKHSPTETRYDPCSITECSAGAALPPGRTRS